MSEHKPNWGNVVDARAKFDEQINKAMVLIAPAGDRCEPITEQMAEFVTARIKAARRQLDRFEDAVKGGA